MTTKPRILMVIAFLHEMGGAQRQALLLAKSLRDEGLNVTFLTAAPPRGVATESTGDIPVRRVPFPHGLTLGPLKFHLLIREMLRDMLTRQGEYDIIHVHQALWPAYAATLASERLAKPCIIKVGNTGERSDFAVLEKSPFFGKRMARHCRIVADKIVVTSRAAMREVEAYGVKSDRLALIPNGVLIPEIGPAPDPAVRQLLGIRSDERLVLFVSALRPHKRPLLALESFADLPSAEIKNTRMWFLGEGPLRNKLTHRIEQLGLEDRVRAIGHVADVDPYLRAADVFLLPSIAEGMSNALLEAMAHALPCIATRISGSEDLIEDKRNGLLVPPDDPVAMTAALNALLGDPGLRRALGDSARKTIESGYSISSIARRYVELYESLRR